MHFTLFTWAKFQQFDAINKVEQVDEISNNVVYATSKASNQPAHTRSLTRAFAGRLSVP